MVLNVNVGSSKCKCIISNKCKCRISIECKCRISNKCIYLRNVNVYYFVSGKYNL